MMSSIKFMTAQFEAESISLLLFFFFILGWSAQLLANANKLAPSMHCMYHTDSDTI